MSKQSPSPEAVVEDFAERKYKNKEETWAATCRRAAEAFIEWCEHENIDPFDYTFDRYDLEDFRNHQQETTDLAENTVKNQCMAVRELFRYAYSRHDWNVEFGDSPVGIMEADIGGTTLRYEEETGVEIPYISDDQHEAIMDECENPRDLCLFSVLYDTGARPSEIRRLKLDEWDYEERCLHLETSKRENHTREVYVSPRTKRRLGRWTKGGERQAYSTCAAESDYLFPTERSPKMSEGTINRQLDRWATRAGVQEVAYEKEVDHKMPWRDDEWEETTVTRQFKTVSAKGYRHALARRAIINGASLGELAAMTGHSSPDSLKHYLKAFGSEEQKDIFDNFS